MLGPTPLRDILLVASFELREMLRTRRALVVIVLYMLGGLLAARAFVAVIASLEEALAGALGTQAASLPGAMTNQLIQEPTYRRTVLGLFQDQTVGEFVLGLPPIVIFYAWSSFQLVPFFIMFTASDTVAHEVQNRGVRFIALRTGRIEFILGKVLGQAGLLTLVTLLMGLVYVAVAKYGLAGADTKAMLLGLLKFWPRVAIYGLPFIGMLVMLTTTAGSTIMALARALVGLFGAWLLHLLANRWSGEGIWDLLAFLLPFAHEEELWSPDWGALISASINLLGLAALYAAIGLFLLRRRDL